MQPRSYRSRRMKTDYCKCRKCYGWKDYICNKCKKIVNVGQDVPTVTIVEVLMVGREIDHRLLVKYMDQAKKKKAYQLRLTDRNTYEQLLIINLSGKGKL